MTRPGIEPRSPGSLANTQLIGPVVFLKSLTIRNNSNLVKQIYFLFLLLIYASCYEKNNRIERKYLSKMDICLNFWDEIWLFLSFSVFVLLSSSWLLYSKRFSRCVLRPSSGVSCRIREPTRNFESNPSFNPRGYIVLIPLTSIGV